ncbi:MAG: DUF2157 domain-containing protein [Candidatus Thiodiazotropha sp. (ex Notomyrtea botanica)]|nr:DUF2157 domain-containing protein [Candidatus Thiodiazotropha sp. (ex Notomyrtea botanica)]
MHKEIIAGYSDVQELAQELKLSEAAYRRAMTLAGLAPDQTGWLRHIDRFLIALGALLIVAGIAAFFAWNWADLSHMTKFALIEGGIAGTAVLAWRFGLDTVAGRISLLTATFLTGTLLAVFGQVYQTGADPYGLFLTWSLLILPWAIIGRQTGIWMLLQILLNLTVIMYYTQVLHPPDGLWQLSQLLGPLVWLGTTVMDSTLASYLFVLNVLALLIWEFGAYRSVSWMQGTLFPRVITFVAFSTVLLPTLVIIVAAGFEEQARLSVVSPILLLAATGAALYYYQYRRHDLFILTCSLLGMIMVITAFFIRHMMSGSGSLLFLALLVIAQVAGAAWWLRQIALRWETRS